MTTTYRFELETLNASNALLRIIMVFARRRLTLNELHWGRVDIANRVKLSVYVDCTPVQATELNGQLGRIIEVVAVSMVPELAQAAA